MPEQVWLYLSSSAFSALHRTVWYAHSEAAARSGAVLENRLESSLSSWIVWEKGQKNIIDTGITFTNDSTVWRIRIQLTIPGPDPYSEYSVFCPTVNGLQGTIDWKYTQ